MNLWQTVLSTTIVARFRGELHVLTGKRTADGNNTHVNVASTPTMRIPIQEAGMLLAEDVPVCLNGLVNPSSPCVSDSLRPSVAHLPDNSDLLAYKIGSLLATKLEIGSALERAKVSVGRASVARCVTGFSYLDDNPQGEPLYEPIIMLGAIVGLNQEVAQQIPIETISYSHLGWTKIGTYVHGVATKTLLEVIPSARPTDELEICVRGLCNATSSIIVRNQDELQCHLTEGGILPHF